MTSRRIIVCGLAFALLPLGIACGNYSNEDLDYQLALPEASDMQAKMQAQIRPDSAEYYQITHNYVAVFNLIIDEVTNLLDHVRSFPPTSRIANERSWGPFPSDKFANWEIQVVMSRSALSSTLLTMDYHVDFRQKGQDASGWVSLLAGSYTSQGGARSAEGKIRFSVQALRAAGYPADQDAGLKGCRELEYLDLNYRNAVFPKTVEMTVTNLPSADMRSGHFQLEQNQDGSGKMVFDFQGRAADTGKPFTATMTSRWLESGAGRADMLFEPTTWAILFGTDCWGPDTVASYSYRWENKTTPETGDRNSCAF